MYVNLDKKYKMLYIYKEQKYNYNFIIHKIYRGEVRAQIRRKLDSWRCNRGR